MNRGWALAALVLLATAGALALRLPRLAARPIHADEAVNAIKATALWQQGRYAYDPHEFHGPALHYATLPALWSSGARNSEELDDAVLRLTPVGFGAGLVLLTLLFADGLGRRAAVCAATLTAVSPAMVFYSRYFIHEMLLVGFTTLFLGAGWRYTRARSLPWAILAGAGAGLMWVTKETFVLALAAMAAAALVVTWNVPPTRTLGQFWNSKHAAFAGLTAACIWVVFFSSFFTNAAGLPDSIRTYLPWLGRAGGESPHIHPWWFYLHRLAWFHQPKGPVWSESVILGLALIGAVWAFAGVQRPLARFLAVYTAALTAAYCAIPYKTPWCSLGFLHGMILLAGVGAAALLEWLHHSRGAQGALAAALVASAGHLAWQAWRASVVYPADPKNPYVYAQTSPDLATLGARAEGLAQAAPRGYDTVIKVIAPEGDYWPLPWSLRRFKQIGWYETLPADPYAPIIVVSTSLNARLDEKSNKRWIMTGITMLRPGRFFELYVEFELWKTYVEQLPRSQDEAIHRVPAGPEVSRGPFARLRSRAVRW